MLHLHMNNLVAVTIPVFVGQPSCPVPLGDLRHVDSTAPSNLREFRELSGDHERVGLVTDGDCDNFYRPAACQYMQVQLPSSCGVAIRQKKNEKLSLDASQPCEVGHQVVADSDKILTASCLPSQR